MRLHELYPEANAPENVVDQIRKLITSGELKPGQRLNQRKLASRLGVTTTPLREALGKLEREGTLVRINGVGVFVRRYSAEEVRDLYLIREVLEGLAARLCAERATDRDLDELRQIADEVFAARSAKDLRALKEKEIEFHEKVAACSGSLLLEEDLRRALFIRRTVVSVSGPELQPEDMSPLSDHRLLVEYIQSRDGGKAEKLMREHVANGLAAALKWQTASAENEEDGGGEEFGD